MSQFCFSCSTTKWLKLIWLVQRSLISVLVRTEKSVLWSKSEHCVTHWITFHIVVHTYYILLTRLRNPPRQYYGAWVSSCKKFKHAFLHEFVSTWFRMKYRTGWNSELTKTLWLSYATAKNHMWKLSRRR